MAGEGDTGGRGGAAGGNGGKGGRGGGEGGEAGEPGIVGDGGGRERHGAAAKAVAACAVARTHFDASIPPAQ
eukprot:4314095-Prymnesium_polylepis.2